MAKNAKNTGEKSKKISVQLLVVLVPMIALFIICVAAIIFTNSRSIITEQGINALEKESKSNANDISSTMEGIKAITTDLQIFWSLGTMPMMLRLSRHCSPACRSTRA